MLRELIVRMTFSYRTARAIIKGTLLPFLVAG